MIEPEGNAVQEDWTGLEERTFCLNRRGENFRELALVITNKNRPPKPTGKNKRKEQAKIHLDDVQLIVEAETGGCSEKRGHVIVERSVLHERNTHREHEWASGDWEKRTDEEEQEIRAAVRFTIELDDAAVEKGLNTVTESYDITNASLKTFNLDGQAVTTETHYDSNRDCTYETLKTKTPATPPRADLDHGGSFSITFDLETGKAKWITLPAFQVTYDLKEKISSRTRGCSDREDTEDVLSLPHQIFTLGPVNVPSKEDLAAQARPDLEQMKQIAEEMQKVGENIWGKDPKDMAKMAERFEKQFDTDKLAQSFARKIVSPDLRVTSGDGKHNFQGGGSKTVTKPLEHGTARTRHTFKWQVFRSEGRP